VTKQLDPIDFHRVERNAMEVNEDHLRTFMLLHTHFYLDVLRHFMGIFSIQQ